jgi:hypothetical protein
VLVGAGMWLLHRAGRRGRGIVASSVAKTVVPPPAPAISD